MVANMWAVGGHTCGPTCGHIINQTNTVYVTKG